MAKKKYVDENGLLYLWQKIKNLFALKATTLSGYGITDAMTATEIDTAIQNALSGITGISYSVVEELPESGEAGVIYLISNSGTNPNSYDEYIYVSNAFEKIGTTDVDLSDYMQKTDIEAITNAEIDAIIAT